MERRETLEAVIQADPGLRATTVGLGGIPDDGEDGRLHRLCHLWDQDTLKITGPLDDVLREDLKQRFVTVVKVQLRLATAHAKLIAHMLGLLNHTLGHHRQNGESETPSSLLRAIRLWHIPPALLHSHDGRVKRRGRFGSFERGNVTFISPIYDGINSSGIGKTY